MPTPRLFLARHGETAWTLTGQHTGVSEIPLTPLGETQVALSSTALIGRGKHIDPSNLTRIYISPRIRARQTAGLLIPDTQGAEVVIEERVREWGYGRYEGMRPKEILEDRRKRGLDIEGFSIWKDGCEDSADGIGVGKGESAKEMAGRIDEVIAEIRGIQGRGIGEGRGDVDILIASHGHFLRAFTKRWLGLSLDFPLTMVLEPGGIATLTYACSFLPSIITRR
ncbi:phosphoglycerate mutase-like protein [Choiromyces venosus 120613-1]|uniref:Phosphoglycerate mutase-like protein n=1 Tax=Choiromyces venosus 120613-1 TaxID=1336337 RepID=A0A3N4J9Q0_9PEZI|nr:phosphoglycerate mutase-like protein [Choiromyces venosus 120613-1]